jgi:uncharacterized protein (DUF4213/DUF364 family)
VSIIDRLLHSLETDADVAELRIGLFWTAVVLDVKPPVCGLASTVHRDCSPYEHAVTNVEHLHTRTGHELASLLRSNRTVEASVGMAALNAFLAQVAGRHPKRNAREQILRKGLGKHVVIVGHFPFVDDVRKASARCSVLELRPRHGDLPADKAAMVLPEADVVALTSTSIINHTFDELISLCRSDAYVVVLGGSTPLSSILFDFGVDMVAGVSVHDVSATIRAVSQGATFRQIPGKELVAFARSESGPETSRPQEEK